MQGHVGLGFRDEGLGFREGVSGLEFSRDMQVFLGLYRDIQGGKSCYIENNVCIANKLI